MKKFFYAKLVMLILIVFFLTACSSKVESTSEEGSQTPEIEKIQELLIPSQPFAGTPGISPSPLSPSISAEINSTPASTPSPTPNLNTYQTPTQLPKPHIIDILNWEMAIATSSPICEDCDTSITTVKAPPGLNIALIQIFVIGEIGSSSIITSTMAFGNEANCIKSSNTNICAIIFGQVSFGEISLFANHESGGQQQLEYYITFQEWANYLP